MTSTLERLEGSTGTNSMLDRLHGGALPHHFANEYRDHHMVSGGRPHRQGDFPPAIRTDKRVPTASGIPSEILAHTKAERDQEMREDQRIMLKMFQDNGTITENY